jgi:nitrite reductase (NADH) small subunit
MSREQRPRFPGMRPAANTTCPGHADSAYTKDVGRDGGSVMAGVLGVALVSGPSGQEMPSAAVSTAPAWVAVCRLSDIVPGTGVCALVHGRQVAVFRLDDDSVYALDNYDPFSRANVLARGIVGDLKGELVVASPVYKQHFSLVSGRCLEEPGIRIGVFAARVQGDTVWVRAVEEGTT